MVGAPPSSGARLERGAGTKVADGRGPVPEEVGADEFGAASGSRRASALGRIGVDDACFAGAALVADGGTMSLPGAGVMALPVIGGEGGAGAGPLMSVVTEERPVAPMDVGGRM